MARLKIDFDGNWKEIITEFFPEFIAFFLPLLYAQIDFSVPVEYLEQELQRIVEAIPNTPKNITDKLVKVRLKNGKDKLILIHIEIQSYFEKLFSTRLFLMYALIFQRHNQDIATLAVYTSNKTPRAFDNFKREAFGTSMEYKFNTYKIMEQKEEDLIANKNIFALFVLANFYVNKTRKELRTRLAMKEKLFELALERGIPKEKISRLVFFIDNIMRIPVDLQEEFDEFVYVKLKKKRNLMTIVQERAKHWTNVFAKNYYGDTVENLIVKEQEKEREKERAKEQERLKKQQENISKQVIKLHFDKKWTIDAIADLLELPTTHIRKIIKQYKAEKNVKA